MTAITIPLTPELDNFIINQLKHGYINSKAELVRQALNMYRENFEVEEIMQASREAREGKLLKGDLRMLAKAFK